MKIALLAILLVSLAGCASVSRREWNHERRASLQIAKQNWMKCVELNAYQWLDEDDKTASAETKKRRTTLNNGQMFVEVLSTCQNWLALKGTLDLSGRETDRFIAAAHKQFLRIGLDIAHQHELETI